MKLDVSGWLVGGVMFLVVMIPVGFGVANELRGSPAEPVLEDADYQFWVFSDPHVSPNGRTEISDAIADLAGTGTGDALAWDIALVPGDWIGRQDCPESSDGLLVRDQIIRSGVDPHRIYGAIGNHDADEDYQWFQTWIDPMGTHPTTSGISNASRPYPVEGAWDHYRFETSDFVFLVLGDRNAPGEPFGRDCEVKRGYPAGGYSLATYQWWVRQVEAAEKPVITVAHHALHDTTAYTRTYEGADNGIHSKFTEADRIGSSFVFGIGDIAYPDRDFGFIQYLEEHPGAIAMWIHGHTHTGFVPGQEFWGNRDIVIKHDVVFMNAGAITSGHAPPEVPYSHIVQYFKDDGRLVITPYLHDVWEQTHPAGLYEKGQFVAVIDD